MPGQLNTDRSLFTAFAIGTGRSGTTFLHEIMAKDKKVDSSHERHIWSDSYLRFVRWYQLNVDVEGCWAIKQAAVEHAHNKGEDYFESSQYISFHTLELHELFDAKFIFLIRHPIQVVNSYFSKGWYAPPICRKDPRLPPSMQPGHKYPHHHFGRIMAFQDEGKDWDNLSRIGKIAWYWKTVNQRILEDIKKLPENSILTTRLEDFSFDKYEEMYAFLNREPALSKKKFERIVKKKPNRRKRTIASKDWSKKEWEEFLFYTREIAEKMGYSLNSPV
jgi:hypothetical protein